MSEREIRRTSHVWSHPPAPSPHGGEDLGGEAPSAKLKVTHVGLLHTPHVHQLKASGRAVWAESPSPWPPPRPSQGGGKCPLWRSKSPSLARLERGIEGERHVQPGLSWCMWGCIAIHLYGGAAKQRPYLIGFARSWTEGLCKSLTAFARAFVGNRRNHCAESCLSLLLCSLGASFVTKHAAARQASFVGACALVAANGRRGE